MKLRVDSDLRLFLIGVLLITAVSLGVVIAPGNNAAWSTAYILFHLYFLWLGVRGKYYSVLAIIATVSIILAYFLSIERDDWGLATFSGSLIAIFTVWTVVYFMYRQKRHIAKELKDKARLDAMFENATEGMLMVDHAGEIILFNAYAEQLFGYNRSEVIGSSMEKLIPSRFAKQHVTHRKGYHAAPRNRPMGAGLELYALHKDGHEFPVEISLGHFKADSEVVVIAFVNDISERKKAAEQIRREQERTKQLNEELELRVIERTSDLAAALDRLKTTNENLQSMEVELLKTLEKERELGELKSRFVTMASHEFRTPLSTILSSLFLLENYGRDEYEQAKATHMSRIKRAVNNMTSILNDFLSLSKMEEGKVEITYAEMDIRQRIVEIVDEMNTVKKRDQTIRYEHMGPTDEILMDEQFLRNILINLVSNAIKFSGDDGTISIGSTIAGGKLRLQVTDNGVGIPEEEQKHLFNRFFRARNVQNINGTGLGLHIVKRYVDMMKGTISLTSVQGETSFAIEIPLLPEPSLG
ncbi:PAS domain S-box protein [Parapedobacter sp. ISTM3]|uniref:sensor histidine kinase n=1 Tax=Parapedobacter sp. ISTM3 TaxID=2800130 RepID=UPI001904D6B0|nr:PAS domain-containing sensor histidine kinase [Parapedobacter sp. ISTM3]MBK1439942.1 PAS domain S-box protein [Parapedobacter sp. ISTM3]